MRHHQKHRRRRRSFSNRDACLAQTAPGRAPHVPSPGAPLRTGLTARRLLRCARQTGHSFPWSRARLPPSSGLRMNWSMHAAQKRWRHAIETRADLILPGGAGGGRRVGAKQGPGCWGRARARARERARAAGVDAACCRASRAARVSGAGPARAPKHIGHRVSSVRRARWTGTVLREGRGDGGRRGERCAGSPLGRTGTSPPSPHRRAPLPAAPHLPGWSHCSAG
jgi:hypothetical protein